MSFLQYTHFISSVAVIFTELRARETLDGEGNGDLTVASTDRYLVRKSVWYCDGHGVLESVLLFMMYVVVLCLHSSCVTKLCCAVR
jgi:hypothetical protein